MSAYRLSPSAQRKLLLVAGALLLLPGLFLVLGAVLRDGALLATSGVIGVIMAPFVGYLIYSARYPTLTVSPEGVTLRGVLGRRPIHIPWDAIERLRLAPGSEAIVLKAPLDVPAARRFSDWSGLHVNGAPLYDDEQQLLIAQQRLIPFQAFAEWLRRGPLLAEFKQHAPHLAEQFESTQTEIQRHQEANRRVGWQFLLAMAVLIVPSILLGIFGSQLPDGAKRAINSAGNAIDVIFRVLLLLVLPLTATMNLRSAWQFLRSRRFGMTLLWTCMALLQLLLVLAVLGSFLPDAKGATP